MKITNQEVTVAGIKPSRFQSDDGKLYDSTKFYIDTDLAESTGGIGRATVEYSLGTSADYEKYKHLTCPFIALADMEISTTGKVQKVTLTALRPKSAAPATPKAA